MNYWLKRAMSIIEKEILLVRQSPSTRDWFSKMPSSITAIVPEKRNLYHKDDFRPVVGNVHHMRYTKMGIEGVLQAPRKYQRYHFYVLYDKSTQPDEPFWLVLHKERRRS